MRRMAYVGLGVYADTIAVVTVEDGRDGEVRFHGVIENSADSLLRLKKRLAATGATPVVNDEWQLLSRFMQVETMAELSPPTFEEEIRLQITPRAA